MSTYEKPHTTRVAMGEVKDGGTGTTKKFWVTVVDMRGRVRTGGEK